MEQSLGPRIVGEVRAEIARQGLTSGAVADQAGIARSSMSRKLAGRSEFTLSELLALATALDVPLANLVARAVDEAASA